MAIHEIDPEVLARVTERGLRLTNMSAVGLVWARVGVCQPCCENCEENDESHLTLPRRRASADLLL